MKIGQVLYIFVASSAGEPMREVQEVTAIAGVGLSGDRYASDRGAFSNAKRKTIRQATVIALDAIHSANAELEQPFLPSETRRNIVIKDISAEELNELVGREFTIGEARVLGIEFCSPCNRPSKLSGKPEFLSAFRNRGGLRIEILETGRMRVDDEVCLSKCT